MWVIILTIWSTASVVIWFVDIIDGHSNPGLIFAVAPWVIRYTYSVIAGG